MRIEWLHINIPQEHFAWILAAWFAGILIGWFSRKGNFLAILFGCYLCWPILAWMCLVDLWYLTLAFVIGLLIHTAKPLWRKFTQ